MVGKKAELQPGKETKERTDGGRERERARSTGSFWIPISRREHSHRSRSRSSEEGGGYTHGWRKEGNEKGRRGGGG